MTALGIDLGGTKLSFAVFSQQGEILHKQTVILKDHPAIDTGDLLTGEIKKLTKGHYDIRTIGVAVPGIYHQKKGTVWAPNIPGWNDYPLLEKIRQSTTLPVTIDSDRACYILGESWMGNAKGCDNAIYLAVGTGIGAGILINGTVLRGAHDIAGAIGWLALHHPFEDKYVSCGCFEYHASGEGIANTARDFLQEEKEYNGMLKQKDAGLLTAHDVFAAYEQKDELAIRVFKSCIRFWGMAVANLVSLFNPEKIILGGGVFGPALQFIPAIKNEAAKWAQPISMKQVSIEASALGTDAGLYGAALMALREFHLPADQTVNLKNV